MTSYLSNRQQRVAVGDTLSHPSTVLRGVPQGSLLGVLFFAVFINDLDRVCHGKLTMYADDTSIRYEGHSEQDLVAMMTTDLARVNRWCQG